MVTIVRAITIPGLLQVSPVGQSASAEQVVPLVVEHRTLPSGTPVCQAIASLVSSAVSTSMIPLPSISTAKMSMTPEHPACDIASVKVGVFAAPLLVHIVILLSAFSATTTSTCSSPLMSTPSTANASSGSASMTYPVNVGGCAPSLRYQLMPLPPPETDFAALMTSMWPSPSTSTATTAFAVLALVVITLVDGSPVPSSKLASTHVFPVEQSESSKHE